MDPNPSPTPPELKDSRVEANTELSDIDQALREFHVMVRYALGEGLPIDGEARTLVAAVELAQDAAFQPAPSGKTVPADLVNQLMAAHSALVKIVAPATPKSLEATEPAPGWTGSLRRPILVGLMILIGLAAALGFIATSVVIIDHTSSSGENNINGPVGTGVFPAMPRSLVQDVAFVSSADPEKPSAVVSPNAHSWLKQLNWLFAAALGAVFYVLFTAHDYVKNRTFDPRYNGVYLIRFVLGVFAGLILANVAAAPLLNENQTFRNLGPAVIALLGGFSTEAVYQVLQRLS